MLNRIALLVFVAGFGLWGLMTIFTGTRNLLLAGRSRGWPTTAGVVLQSTIRRGGSTRHRQGLYRPDVIYGYQAGSSFYQGRTISFGRPDEPFAGARFDVARYPVGMRVRVAFDPDHPEVSCLEATEPSAALWVAPLVGIACIGLAAWVAFPLSRLLPSSSRRSKPRRTPGRKSPVRREPPSPGP